MGVLGPITDVSNSKHMCTLNVLLGLGDIRTPDRMMKEFCRHAILIALFIAFCTLKEHESQLILELFPACPWKCRNDCTRQGFVNGVCSPTNQCSCLAGYPENGPYPIKETVPEKNRPIDNAQPGGQPPVFKQSPIPNNYPPRRDDLSPSSSSLPRHQSGQEYNAVPPTDYHHLQEGGPWVGQDLQHVPFTGQPGQETKKPAWPTKIENNVYPLNAKATESISVGGPVTAANVNPFYGLHTAMEKFENLAKVPKDKKKRL